ncbi:MAG: protein-(glutamine-N5) methyltransferase, release factor-specific [Bacteroidetes bacterium 4572_117]|nr:MAG: protein-(glutamine-N5) methyltransferase, release factor-specific [Bacteroidetes bacterium 4572_117]
MASINSIIKTFKSELRHIYPNNEIQAFIEILLAYYTGLSKTDLIIKTDETVDSAVCQQIESSIVRLKNMEPVQYIIGETEFYDLKIKVNPAVLIPRPETEELVHWLINNHKKDKKTRVLDIGTGSGCIPLALKNNLPDAEIFALDVSKKALEIAKKNAKINKLDISFVQLDILNAKNNNNLGMFDIIVSNPPYVRGQEKTLMHKNVLDNEPHLALFVKNNEALVFYEAIIGFAKHHMHKKGCLYFEINEAYGKQMIELFEKNNYKNIELKQDINGKDRMIRAMKY